MLLIQLGLLLVDYKVVKRVCPKFQIFEEIAKPDCQASIAYSRSYTKSRSDYVMRLIITQKGHLPRGHLVRTFLYKISSNNQKWH